MEYDSRLIGAGFTHASQQMETAIATAISRSDALVFFGASGDLAYKKIFPALLAMSRQDDFHLPIIGVAHSGWDSEKLRQRARESIAQASTDAAATFDEAAFTRFAARMQYVDGDYNDPATFQLLKKALGTAQRPLHYLGINRYAILGDIMEARIPQPADIKRDVEAGAAELVDEAEAAERREREEQAKDQQDRG